MLYTDAYWEALRNISRRPLNVVLDGDDKSNFTLSNGLSLSPAKAEWHVRLVHRVPNNASADGYGSAASNRRKEGSIPSGGAKQ